jgi:hypothetical protein
MMKGIVQDIVCVINENRPNRAKSGNGGNVSEEIKSVSTKYCQLLKTE